MGVRCGGAGMWGTSIPQGSKEPVPMPGTWAGLCLQARGGGMGGKMSDNSNCRISIKEEFMEEMG